MKLFRTLTSAVLAAAFLVAMSACTLPNNPLSPDPSAKMEDMSDTNVQVTYQIPDPMNPEIITQQGSWTLDCRVAVGTHPQAGEACAVLADIDLDTLKNIPGNRACTEMFGGPQTATIRGTVRGTPVNVTMGRANGCQISQWDAMGAVLAPVPAASTDTVG